MKNAKRNTEISVIMPAYNADKYVSRALDCIVSQSFKGFEAIIIDDGSTDNTATIVKGICAKDERIKYCYQNNKGAASARNHGIEMAIGSYLLFLDADDSFEEDYFEKMYLAAIENDSQIVVCNADAYDSNTGKILYHIAGHRGLKSGTYYSDSIRNRVFSIFIGHPWNKLIKSSIQKEHALLFQEIRHSNDNYFIFMSIEYSERITCIDDVLVHHRIGSGNSLRDTSVLDPLCDLYAFDAIRDALIENGFMNDQVLVDFNSFCIKTLNHLIIKCANCSKDAIRILDKEYFEKYEIKWAIKFGDVLKVRPIKQCILYVLLRRINSEGHIWVFNRYDNNKCNSKITIMDKVDALLKLLVSQSVPRFRKAI